MHEFASNDDPHDLIEAPEDGLYYDDIVSEDHEYPHDITDVQHRDSDQLIPEKHLYYQEDQGNIHDDDTLDEIDLDITTYIPPNEVAHNQHLDPFSMVMGMGVADEIAEEQAQRMLVEEAQRIAEEEDITEHREDISVGEYLKKRNTAPTKIQKLVHEVCNLKLDAETISKNTSLEKIDELMVYSEYGYDDFVKMINKHGGNQAINSLPLFDADTLYRLAMALIEYEYGTVDSIETAYVNFENIKRPR